MTPVEVLYNEYKSVVDFLDGNAQPSLSSDVNKYFKKVIVLSSASYFEHRIQEILIEFVSKETNGSNRLVNFFKKKAIGLQYHTYFAWGEKDKPEKPGKNANSFFALFGEDFKKEVEAELRGEEALEVAVRSFLEIGHLRNILVHSNFAAYNLDSKTTDEIFALYQKASPFVDYVKGKLNLVEIGESGDVSVTADIVAAIDAVEEAVPISSAFAS